MLIITEDEVIRQGVIKNLLSAHKRIAETGKVSEIIRFSNYLFRLGEKRNNVLTDFVPENQQRGSDEPV